MRIIMIRRWIEWKVKMCFLSTMMMACIICLLVGPTTTLAFSSYTKSPFSSKSRLSIDFPDSSLLLDYIRDVILLPDHLTFEEERSILKRVAEEHQRDVEASSFVIQKDDGPLHLRPQIPAHEHIHVAEYALVTNTVDAILTDAERQKIIQAAECQWKHQSSPSSRFTIQRPGNYEVHTADLGLTEAIFNPLLQDQIYPWLSQAFDYCGHSLCVYDSLVIRYNATEAKKDRPQSMGASQPLHKDLGIFSVNILLSRPESFQGGGTFFENQLWLDKNIVPLQPVKAGAALAHRSDERHAGAATIQGVRDILVFFIMSTSSGGLSSPRLKASSDVNGDIVCRMKHHYLATRSDPSDGEAWLYLATSLLDRAASSSTKHTAKVCLETSRKCLQHASQLCPCDARVWNNLGLASSRLVLQHEQIELTKNAEHAFETCLGLLKSTMQAGCDVSADTMACRLNYGLFLSNLDRFQEAATILEPLTQVENENQDTEIVHQATRLYNFCLQKS